MAQVYVTLKIMPDSPETNLDKITDEATILVKEFGGSIHHSEQKPVAFGLKQIELTFIMDEDIGSTDKLEEQIAKVEGVTSVNVIDVRRAIG